MKLKVFWTIMNKNKTIRAATLVNRPTQSACQPVVTTSTAAPARRTGGSSQPVVQEGSFKKRENPSMPLSGMVAIDRPWTRRREAGRIQGTCSPKTVDERVLDPLQYWLIEPTDHEPYNAVGQIKRIPCTSNGWLDHGNRGTSSTGAAAGGAATHQSSSK